MSDLQTHELVHDLIHGSCASDFVGVRDAFERNFLLGDEVGAAVAVWVDDELVVDLWGGWADAAGTRPWRQDTLTTVLSGTKGLSATCVHQLADRGDLDLQAPVARYWPEFGQAGKEDITLAMVLSHRSGLIGPDAPLSWEDVADWDFVCERLAAAAPRWQPGTAQGYHMTTFGFILGEVFRRVTGRTIGEYLRTEIAEPLGADTWPLVPGNSSWRHNCRSCDPSSSSGANPIEIASPAFGCSVRLAGRRGAFASVNRSRMCGLLTRSAQRSWSMSDKPIWTSAPSGSAISVRRYSPMVRPVTRRNT
ncbi:serine hydrolase domain-containing protein, partial [Mycobacterium sp. E2462]|uniref:serine hydrolase domain-containing protein n=1 Tax=Mycobacterium sp. E2462 TaxID=1834133 RepID=UPI000ACBCA14